MNSSENRFYREPTQYLVWSEEHGAWWGADETNLNYTRSILRATRYSQARAYEIADDANRYLRPDEPIKEVPIPDPLTPAERRAMSPPAPDDHDDPEAREV